MLPAYRDVTLNGLGSYGLARQPATGAPIATPGAEV